MQSYKIFLFLTVLFCCQSVLAFQKREVILSGTVLDKHSKAPIVGATISWENGKKGTIADVNGKFRITLSPGSYAFTISAVGKKSEQKTISIQKDIAVDFLLDDDIQQLSVITVKSEREITTLKSASMGITQMSIESIKKMPAIMGEVDVVRSMITLPGVSSVGEGAGGFNVRGGSVGQNLILMDDAPIYFTSHLFGFFSVFNEEVVDDIRLYKASIPARYGGRLSSVFTVNSKNPIADSITVKGGIGLVSSRLSVAAPIIKNKLGVMVAARTTYSDWLLRAVNNAQLENSSASFYDLNLKLSYRPSDKSRLSLSMYNGRDKFAFSADTLYQYGNTSATLKHNQELSSSLNISSILSYSNNYSTVRGSYSNQQFDLDISNKSYTVKTYLGAEFERHYLEGGLEVNIFDLNPGRLHAAHEQSIINNIRLENDRGIEWAVFLEDNIDLGNFRFIAGIRYSSFSKLGSHTHYHYDSERSKSPVTVVDSISYGSFEKVINYAGPEPRISMSYMIDENNSLKIGYMRNRQNIHLIANNAAIVPTDIYRLSNHHILPEIADQYSVGFFKNFQGDSYESSIELYYKNMQNAYDFKEGANLLLNKQLEAEIVYGNSFAYGAELSLSKNVGDLKGRLSYTYSRAFFQATGVFEDERINDGKRYPAYYDKPHDITGVVSYQINENWSFNTNFTYSTGRPISVPISKYKVGAIAVGEFSERNQYRVPDYHRLDIAFNYDPDKNHGKVKGNWVFSVYNLYGRKNAFSVFFRDENGAPPQAYRLAILGIPFPSVTYNFSF